MGYKSTGKERDSESGLDNLGAPYDSSNFGRFMSPDALGGHQEDPQNLNKYSYVRNDPLNLTDPTGLDFYLSRTNKDHKDCKGFTLSCLLGVDVSSRGNSRTFS